MVKRRREAAGGILRVLKLKNRKKGGDLPAKAEFKSFGMRQGAPCPPPCGQSVQARYFLQVLIDFPNQMKSRPGTAAPLRLRGKIGK